MWHVFSNTLEPHLPNQRPPVFPNECYKRSIIALFDTCRTLFAFRSRNVYGRLQNTFHKTRERLPGKLHKLPAVPRASVSTTQSLYQTSEAFYLLSFCDRETQDDRHGHKPQVFLYWPRAIPVERPAPLYFVPCSSPFAFPDFSVPMFFGPDAHTFYSAALCPISFLGFLEIRKMAAAAPGRDNSSGCKPFLRDRMRQVKVSWSLSIAAWALPGFAVPTPSFYSFGGR
jgi:hypothetical protein